LADVLGPLDLAAEVVQVRGAPGRMRVDLDSLAAAHGLHHRLAPVLLREVEQGGAVELARIRVLERFLVALFPVTYEVGVEHAGPADAALEEREVEFREAAGHAAEEERLAHRLA